MKDHEEIQGIDPTISDFLSLTKKEQDGFLGEFALKQTLEKMKIKHKSNSFIPELWKKGQRKGTDFKLCENKKGVIIEVKNWGPYFVNPSLFDREILDRFKKTDPEHGSKWVLILAESKLGRKVRKLVKFLKITVIEVGFKVTLENFAKAVKILTAKLQRRLSVFSLPKFLNQYTTLISEKLPKITAPKGTKETPQKNHGIMSRILDKFSGLFWGAHLGGQ